MLIGLSLWLIGAVRAEPETVISRAWVQSPARLNNCFRIIGVHALRLISRTGNLAKGLDGVLYNLCLWSYGIVALYKYVYLFILFIYCSGERSLVAD